MKMMMLNVLLIYSSKWYTVLQADSYNDNVTACSIMIIIYYLIKYGGWGKNDL